MIGCCKISLNQERLIVKEEYITFLSGYKAFTSALKTLYFSKSIKYSNSTVIE